MPTKTSRTDTWKVAKASLRFTLTRPSRLQAEVLPLAKAEGQRARGRSIVPALWWLNEAAASMGEN